MTVQTIGCPEAEAAVLGCLLQMPAGEAAALSDQLEVEDFTDPRHRAVYEAVIALVLDGTTPDPVTVLGELRRTGAERSMTCDRSAGVFLGDLLAAAPAVVNAGHYGRVVVEHRARRRLAEAGQRLLQLAGTVPFRTVREVALDEWTALLAQVDRVTSEAGQEVR
jgi:replicative DNA helicase